MSIPLLLIAALAAAEPGFKELEPGVELGEFAAPNASAIGDSRITVVRLDPAKLDFELQLANEVTAGGRLDAAAWAKRGSFVAVSNAGMFEPDLSTTFYSRNGTYVSNATESAKAGAVLVMGPKDASLPAARVVDTRCEDWAGIREQYTVHLQSYRMVNCAGEPAWKENGRIWSHSSIGMDGGGRILFVHARSPWSTHAFTANLLALPLDIKRLMYSEGGPEASLFLAAAGTERNLFGSYETGFFENDGNDRAWPLPNVVGVKTRAPAKAAPSVP